MKVVLVLTAFSFFLGCSSDSIKPDVRIPAQAKENEEEKVLRCRSKNVFDGGLVVKISALKGQLTTEVGADSYSGPRWWGTGLTSAEVNHSSEQDCLIQFSFLDGDKISQFHLETNLANWRSRQKILGGEFVRVIHPDVKLDMAVNGNNFNSEDVSGAKEKVNVSPKLSPQNLYDPRLTCDITASFVEKVCE